MRRAPLLAALVAAALLATPVPATATPHHPGSHNPVSAGAADTFADPAVIRGRDGFWYAYGTSDPLFAGQTEPRLIPILRSRDLFDWTYVGDVFTPATRSDLGDTDGLGPAGARHPLRRAAGRYVLYFTVTDTILNQGDDWRSAWRTCRRRPVPGRRPMRRSSAAPGAGRGFRGRSTRLG